MRRTLFLSRAAPRSPEWVPGQRVGRQAAVGVAVFKVFSQVRQRFVEQIIDKDGVGFRGVDIGMIRLVNLRQKQQKQKYNLGRLRFNKRGASTPLWGVEACSPPSTRPTQSQLFSTPHYTTPYGPTHPQENQQPILGGHRFSREKCQFSLGVKQKHSFYGRKSSNKISLR